MQINNPAPGPVYNMAWVPTINFGGGHTGITYNTQMGVYAVYGKLVFLSAYIVLSNIGVSLGGLGMGVPFVSTNGSRFPFSVQLTGCTSTGQYYAYLDASDNNILFRCVTPAGVESAIGNGQVSNNSYIVVSGFYMTA
jgi:hypothetical protein